MAKKPLIDPSLKKYYAEGSEQDRLSAHRLEKDRTLQILAKVLPLPPRVILDVGGAAGAYAFPLAEKGYEVHLIDPIPLHIEQAKSQAKKSKVHLASYSLGEARNLEWENDSIDVVLLFGPLYHLIKPKDRNKALREAYRVLKPGGLLLATGIARFASFMDAMHKETIARKFNIIEQDFQNGVHEKISQGFTFAYLHHPNELRKEVQKNGFENVTLRAIEGPVWEKRVIDALSQEEEQWKKVLALLERIETEETILGASAHIMAVGNKKSRKK